MKFLRKMVTFFIAVVFLAVAVVCVGMIFAVKNVNVTLITYADDYEESYNGVKDSLSVLNGETIIFVNEDTVSKIVSHSNYSVTSFEKIYPCTINVTVKERVETFAVFVGELYYMYDDEGTYLKGRVETENINTDGSTNVELVRISVEQLPEIAGYAEIFKEKFNALRSIVSSIALDTKPDVEGYTEKLVFNLRCGLKIQIDNYTEYTEEKIEAAYSKFCKLTDREKLLGTLRSYRIGNDDGIINADYSPY